MSEQGDPFNGIWNFNAELSQLSTPAPKLWRQEITAGPEDINVREKIIRSDGIETNLCIQAKFDGNDYHVEGSPQVETITYKRIDPYTIRGTGKKNGAVSLTEIVSIDPDTRELTVTYKIYLGEKAVANGVAIFEINV